MRIAYVTETYPPEVNGVALTVQRCVRHMRRNGHRVLLAWPAPRTFAAACASSAPNWCTWRRKVRSGAPRWQRRVASACR
jgi:hypothetical protein